MNDHIKRITDIERQIEVLRKLRAEGEHEAAGLEITIGLGANDGNPTTLSLSFNTDAVLREIVEGLYVARDFRRTLLKKEFIEAREYLDEMGELPT